MAHPYLIGFFLSSVKERWRERVVEFYSCGLLLNLFSGALFTAKGEAFIRF